MNLAEKLAIAKAWIGLQHAGDQADERHRDFWAHERLRDLTEHDPETAWDLIITILRQDNSDTIVANLGAGPLEDLLGTHGDTFIQRVEELAKRDESFRKVVGCVWQNEIPNAIWMRVKAISSQH